MGFVTCVNFGRSKTGLEKRSELARIGRRKRQAEAPAPSKNIPEDDTNHSA